MFDWSNINPTGRHAPSCWPKQADMARPDKIMKSLLALIAISRSVASSSDVFLILAGFKVPSVVKHDLRSAMQIYVIKTQVLGPVERRCLACRQGFKTCQ